MAKIIPAAQAPPSGGGLLSGNLTELFSSLLRMRSQMQEAEYRKQQLARQKEQDTLDQQQREFENQIKVRGLLEDLLKEPIPDRPGEQAPFVDVLGVSSQGQQVVPPRRGQRKFESEIRKLQAEKKRAEDLATGGVEVTSQLHDILPDELTRLLYPVGSVIPPGGRETLRKSEQDKFTQANLGDRVVLLNEKGEVVKEYPKGETPGGGGRVQIVQDEEGRYIAVAVPKGMEPGTSAVVPAPGEKAILTKGASDEEVAQVLGNLDAGLRSPATQQLKNRETQARVILLSTERIRKMLGSPEVASRIGPAAGRGQELLGKVGIQNPKVAELDTAIKSHAALLAIVHGYRGGHLVQRDFQEMLGGLGQEPSQLLGRLQGVNELAEIIEAGGARKAPQKADPMGIR